MRQPLPHRHANPTAPARRPVAGGWWPGLGDRLRGGLARLGDAGLLAPLLALLVGFGLPGLAALAHAALLPAIALILAISVVLAEPGRLRLGEWGPVLLLGLANLLLTPLLALLAARQLGLGEAGLWLVLVAGCPAAGSAALIAGLLGLPARPMLLAQLLCFCALPLSAPGIAWWLLDGVAIDPAALFRRVLLGVGLAMLAGLGLRLALGPARRQRQARPLRGLGVLALCAIGLGLAHGLTQSLAASPPILPLLGGLLLVSLIGGALGALVGAPFGLARCFALGGAVRNVSLLWGVAAPLAPPGGDLLLQLGVLWTLLLPAGCALGARLAARGRAGRRESRGLPASDTRLAGARAMPSGRSALTPAPPSAAAAGGR